MSGERPISRRDLLRGRLVCRAAPDEAAAAPKGAFGDTRPLTVLHRPPGAVAERDFLAGCTRCGDCITACPVGAITLADARHGPAAGTPVIRPMDSPCVMCEGTPCITACAPGVLSPDAPLRMGTAEIRTQYCLAHQGTLCTVCAERCPVEGAITLERGRPAINVETCTGCGVCQHVCPAPYNAVVILPDRQRVEGAAAPGDDAAARSASPDWRRAYFGNRSLRPDAD